MVAFICLFFPAVVSLWIYERLSKKKMAKRNLVYMLCFNILIINAVCFAAKAFVLSTGAQSLYSNIYSDMNPNVAIRYIIMALPTAVVLSLIEVFVVKNVKVTVHDEDEEKK